MIDVILNAAKIGKEVSASAASLLQLARSTPEWKQGTLSLQAKIPQGSREQANLLMSVAVAMLKKCKFPGETIVAFRSSYIELARNAFEHGCARQTDKVTIGIEATTSYVSVTVVNPKRRKFSPKDITERHRDLLREDPRRKRGRGLVRVEGFADRFERTSRGDGVKAVFYFDRVLLRVHSIENISIIRILSGVNNPAFERKVVSTALGLLQEDLIIDFTPLAILSEDKLISDNSSITEYVILNLEEVYSRAGNKVIALFPYGTDIMLPAEVVVHSWETALDRLSKRHLLKEVQKRVDAPPELLRERKRLEKLVQSDLDEFEDFLGGPSEDD